MQQQQQTQQPQNPHQHQPHQQQQQQPQQQPQHHHHQHHHHNQPHHPPQHHSHTQQQPQQHHHHHHNAPHHHNHHHPQHHHPQHLNHHSTSQHHHNQNHHSSHHQTSHHNQQQPPPAQHHQSNLNSQQQQHAHPIHHQTQIPISPSIQPAPPQQQQQQQQQPQQQQPPPQWPAGTMPPTQPIGTHQQQQLQLPSQQPQQQQQAIPQTNSQSTGQHHPQASSQQQPQQPQVQPPQQQPLPPIPHHMAHPQAPISMIHTQYPAGFPIYPMSPYIRLPSQYDSHPPPPPPAASHQQDSVNINSQAQQPVSINNNHIPNLPLNPIPPQSVINTPTTGANVHHNHHHQLNNRSAMIEPHLNNLSMSHQSYVIQTYPFAPNYVMPTNLNYHQMTPQPHGSPMIPPMRGPNDLTIRQQYDPQNQPANPSTPVVTPMTLPPGAKPPVTMASITPVQTIKPREKKALAIVDPLTKHVFTVDELKGSPATPTTSQSSKDSGEAKILPKDQLSSNESEDVIKSSKSTGGDTIPSDIPVDESTNEQQPQPLQQSLKPSTEPVQSQTVKSILDEQLAKSQETPVVNLQQHQIKDDEKVPKPLSDEKTTLVENGNESSKLDGDEVNSLTNDMTSISISQNNKTETESTEEMDEETRLKKTLISKLPYEAGQYSPLNREGSKKYSINFLRAVAREMNLIKFDPGSNYDFSQYPRGTNFSRDLMRRSSQQMINKPRKVINTSSLQQEVELKTAEKPWKPELEEEKAKAIESNEMDTQRLLKVFRGHLNKLTPQKYDSLIEKINKLDLNGPERLNSVIDLVFDKAVDEPGFCELYARMCKVIAAKDQDFCFHLVKKCQEEFETSDLYDGLNVDEKKIEIERETDLAKKKLMSEELYEEMRVRRKKYLGTIKLIGEMYKLGLLLPKIIGLCMTHLIEEASNENIECLCSLISTVGSKMANEEDHAIKDSLKNTLTVLHQLAHLKSADEEYFSLESRIKFKILDTIDLSKRGWRPRMSENNPKKIEDIREESKVEMMKQQHQNHANQVSKNLSKLEDRDRPPRRQAGQLYPMSKNAGARY